MNNENNNQNNMNSFNSNEPSNQNNMNDLNNDGINNNNTTPSNEVGKTSSVVNSGLSITKIIILIVASFAILGGILYSTGILKKDKASNVNQSNNIQKKEEVRSKTNVYILDYDYSSLSENGDGSNMEYFQSNSLYNNYYKPNELPGKFWTDNKITLEIIKSKKFDEPNPRFLHPFVDSADDYIIYNIDDKSSVEEAYNKGWYALINFKVNNASKKYDYNNYDNKAKFNDIITGLGKPYCVIKSSPKIQNDDEYIYNNALIIYKYDNFYLLLYYYDNTNGKTEKIDLLYAFIVASDDMLQALIKDNATSNNIEDYKQEYIFKNKSNFELLNN